jgi:hypothetical protein
MMEDLQPLDLNQVSAESLPQGQDDSAEFITAIPCDQKVFDRIIGVFVSPREAFQGIEMLPGAINWLVPLMIALVLTSSSFSLRYLTTSAAQDEHTLSVSYLQKLAKNPDLPQETRRQYLETALSQKVDVAQSMIRGAIMGVVFSLLGLFASGVVFFVLARYVFANEDITYGTILTASSLTLLISAVGDVVSFLLQTLLSNSQITTTPAAFLPISTGVLYTTFQQLNIFKIWDLAIFSVAFGSLIRKSTSTGAVLVFGTWLLRIALMATISALLMGLVK